MNQAAQVQSSVAVGTLYMAMEMSASKWKLAFGVGRGHRPRMKTIAAGDCVGLLAEIAKAKARFGLEASAKVVSCYEMGRDGFWPHRFLSAQGITNLPIDASSTQVDRRKRRAKTDRLDAEMLLSHLLRHAEGERKVFRIVQVPSPQAEDARHIQRELEVLKRDRARVSNRIRSLLATQGVGVKSCRELLGKLDQTRIWDGSELRTGLAERLKKELQRWVELTDSIREEEERREQELQAGGFGADQARRLAQLKSIGDETACSFSVECFAYRHFNNGREVGAYVGLTPTPFDSGESRREQGISKAGNARLRWRAIEVSWLWQRYQPDSELTKWFKKRFANGSARQRRIGIVAMARKLVVALWRYLEYGIVPEGATLKA